MSMEYEQIDGRFDFTAKDLFPVTWSTFNVEGQ